MNRIREQKATLIGCFLGAHNLVEVTFLIYALLRLPKGAYKKALTRRQSLAKGGCLRF